MAKAAKSGPLTVAPVYSSPKSHAYTGSSDDYSQVAHSAKLALTSGTISLGFSLDRLAGDTALISKDGNGRTPGDFTVWVEDGTIQVVVETASGNEYIRVPDLLLSTFTTYQFALSFGADGLHIWLNGELVASEPELTQGIAQNDQPLVIGGTHAWNNADDLAHSLFKGTISDVLIYDRQLGGKDMIKLADTVEPGLAGSARMQAAMEDLAPVFQQVHHASDTLVDILGDYGVNAHGHLATKLNMISKGKADNKITGTDAADGINGGRGDDVVKGGDGNDVLQGGYGNDKIWGGNGDDILDGGQGEDRLWGGNGNDLLISRADAREPEIFFDPDRDEGDPLGELTNGKLYADQPIPGDDVLTGGKGADTFYFQTLINAKERYILKHTREDGTINWHGVAGENAKLHDHWVDYLGHDVVTDFSRSEGDRIVIEGHTTEIASIAYGDANGDGVMDHSVISLYSDQGGAGAHQDDRLGTITVYGDLVKLSDIEHTSKPAYGIIKNVDDIKEALAPVDVAKDTGKIKPPKNLPDADDLGLPAGVDPVMAIVGDNKLGGEDGDYMDVGHSPALALANGTISLSFSLDHLPGNMALIAKDESGKGQGGDFTVWIQNGTILVSFETTSGTEYLRVPDLVLSANTTYQFAFSFGADGLNVWLNGDLVATEPEFTQGLAQNDRALVIGGTRAWQNADDDAHSLFEGTIGDVMVFDHQLGSNDMITLANAIDPALAKDARMAAKMEGLAPVFQQLPNGSDTLVDILADYGVGDDGHLATKLNMISKGKGDNKITGTDAADGINGGRGDDAVKGGNGNDVLQGDYGNDKIWGGNGDDILDGGQGEDRLWGGNGDDLLISRADAREPEIFHDPTRDEADPLGELTNGKLYPNQPVPGDDVLTGGKGADTFYFQTLMNAKLRYILKHTNDDGTINWAGVAGENDKLHDHWVDYLGHDVVTDFSRSEGDRIVIEGHTAQISSITYGDANGDGVMDHSVISLYSDQGSGGGAHNDDRLGTIKVYGDLVRMSDISHTAKPTYGIIKDVDDIREALKPKDISKDTGKIAPPKDLPTADDRGLPAGMDPVMAVKGGHDFTPDDRAPLVFQHAARLDLDAGTIAFSFETAKLGGNQALFSKDASGYGTGGHMTAYVNPQGDLIVRLQDATGSHYLEAKHAVKAGGAYDFALSFGPDGVELYLNGARVAYDTDVTVDWADNIEALIVGAAGWNNTSGATNGINNHFNGTITDFTVFDTQLTGDAVFGTDARADYAYFNKGIDDYGFDRDADGTITIRLGNQATILADGIEFVRFNDMTVRVNDIQYGAKGKDDLYGLDGSDVLIGKGGDDRLRGHDNDDLLRGGMGEDYLSGGDGRDQLAGGRDNDRLFGGDAADVLKGGDGDDDLYGDAGNDRFYGGLGDDDIWGHAWNDGGKATNDRAFFDGNLADFTFETKTWYDNNRAETVTQLIVTDSASGGSDGFYEGRDRLVDIDQLVFADQTVAFDDLL